MRWNETVPWQEKYYTFLHMKSVWSWVFLWRQTAAGNHALLLQTVAQGTARCSQSILHKVALFFIRRYFPVTPPPPQGQREQPGKELAFLLVESPAVCFWEVAAPADHFIRNVWWMSLGGYPQIQRTHIFLAEASLYKRLSVLFSRSLYCWVNTQAQLI